MTSIKRIVRFGSLVSVALLAAACGTDAGNSVAEKGQALTATQGRVFGFDTAGDDWSASNGATVVTSDSSMAVTLNSYTELVSIQVDALDAVGDNLSLDIQVPQLLTQGSMRIIVRVPSQNQYWADLGAVSLAGLSPDAFQTLSFGLDSAVQEALKNANGDIEFRIVLQVPQSSGTYLIDNLSVGETITNSGDGDQDDVVGDSYKLSFAVPLGASMDQVLVSAADGLKIDDRSTLGESGESRIISNLSSDATEFGAGVTVNGDVHSVGDVNFLRSHSGIEGSVYTAGNVIRQDNVEVTGSTVEGAAVSGAPVSWTINWPAGDVDAIELPPDAPNVDIVPGAYGEVHAFSRSALTFSAGTYYLESLVLEPEVDFRVDTSAGPVFIYVKNTLRLGVGPNYVAGTRGELMLGYLGLSPASFEKAFVGTVVAPNARVELRRPSDNGAHEGAFFGKSVQVFSDATVKHLPFPYRRPVVETVTPGDIGNVDVTLDPVYLDSCESSEDVVLGTPLSDGSRPIIGIEERDTSECTEEVRYCREIENSDGSLSYEEVEGDIISPEFPVPAAAVSQGCSALPEAQHCTVLSRDEPGLGCEAEPADPDCETITICPEPGDVATASSRPSDPTSVDDPTFLLPQIVRDAIEAGSDFLDSASPLYLSPCEWDPVIEGFSTGTDIAGQAKAGGESCTGDTQCNSGSCDRGPVELFGACTDAVASDSPMFLDWKEGSDKFNVHFKGGIEQGRAKVRGPWYPSAEYDLKVATLADLKVTGFAHEQNIISVDVDTALTECSFDLDYETMVGDDLVNFIGAGVRDSTGLFIEGDGASRHENSGATQQAACESQLSALHAAEKKLNEDLHEALVASTFYNLAGPTGDVVTSRSVAQGFIDQYVSSARAYESARTSFEATQAEAIDHNTATSILHYTFGWEIPIVKTKNIGPFSPEVELGIVSRAGLSDVSIKSHADASFGAARAAECGGVDCFEIGAGSSARVGASVSGYFSMGVGINLLIASGKVWVRGDLDFANVELPVEAQAALLRTEFDPSGFASQLSSVLPSGVPSALLNLLGPVLNPAVAQAFEVTPMAAQYEAPYAWGSSLDTPGEATVEGSFLSGNVKLHAKARVLLATKRWEKTLASWPGKKVDWFVGLPESVQSELPDPEGDFVADTLESFTGAPPLVALPNMVLLPKLTLIDPVLPLSKEEARLETNRLLDTGANFNAHFEEDLGIGWDSGSGRCTPVIIVR